MRLTKQPKGIGSVVLDTLLGACVVGVFFVVGVLFVLLYQLFLSIYALIGKWIVIIPAALPLLWAMGHVSKNLEGGDKHHCKGCNYPYKNVITEWLHKRKCLPMHVANVSGKR